MYFIKITLRGRVTFALGSVFCGKNIDTVSVKMYTNKNDTMSESKGVCAYEENIGSQLALYPA